MRVVTFVDTPQGLLAVSALVDGSAVHAYIDERLPRSWQLTLERMMRRLEPNEVHGLRSLIQTVVTG